MATTRGLWIKCARESLSQWQVCHYLHAQPCCSQETNHHRPVIQPIVCSSNDPIPHVAIHVFSHSAISERHESAVCLADLACMVGPAYHIATTALCVLRLSGSNQQNMFMSTVCFESHLYCISACSQSMCCKPLYVQGDQAASAHQCICGGSLCMTLFAVTPNIRDMHRSTGLTAEPLLVVAGLE